MMPDIYLDIDGVLLANENNPALYADEFIQFVVSNFPTYWLTTHCQGDASVPIQRFGHLFKPDTVEAMGLINATRWNSAKTEAINFGRNFFWLDDDLYSDELIDLQNHNAIDSWIEINLSKDPNALNRLLLYFQKLNNQNY